MSKYEADMEQAQKRLSRFEEDAKLLGDPVQIPTVPSKEGAPIPVANVFFRPPHGISSQFDPKGAPRGGVFYTYSSKGTGPFAFVELAFGDDGKAFSDNVLKMFTIPPPGAQPRKRQVNPPDHSPITFETTEFEDAIEKGYFYSINLWRGSKTQVAIVYYVNKASRTAAGPAIERSLESFGAEAESSQRHQAFKRGSPLNKP